MRHLSMRHRVLFEGEPGPAGGAPNPPQAVEATVRRIMQEGRTEEKLIQLHLDNHDLRTKVKQLEGGAKVPEGGKVLTAEEAKAFDAYAALGKPEELQAAVKKRDELQGELAKRDRETTQRAAAEAEGFKPEVLSKLPGAEGLKFEVREEDVDGQKRPVAYVTEAKDGAVPQKLSAYAEATWKDFLPALQAETAEGEKEPAGGTRTFPAQSAQERRAGGKKAPESVEKIVERRRGSGDYGL